MAGPAAAACRAALRAPLTCARFPRVGAGQAGSTGRRPDAQPVTLRVAKFELAPVGRLACGPAEVDHHRRYVADEQVDQGIRPGIAPVLERNSPAPATSDRHKCGHAGPEAMLPLLGGTQALIPGDCLCGAGHTQHRYDLVTHGQWSHTPGA